MRLLAAVFPAVLLFAVTAQAATVIEVARIRTMDLSNPQAQALAFDEQGKILAVGSSAALRAQFADATRISAGDVTMVPGLIDAHGHVLGLGLSLSRADLVGTHSKGEVIARLKDFAKDLPKGAWLLGRGWDQNDWPQQQFPTALDLDAAFPDRPVWLERIDGHAGWANSAAMKVTARKLSGDWQPDGGKILRVGGKATGIFVDAAQRLVEERIPGMQDAERERAYLRAFEHVARFGLTGVHDAGVSRAELATYRRLADSQRLPIRIFAMADGDQEALADLCAHGLYRHAGGHLQMRTLKLYADGALGSRGAALLADYADDGGNRGLLVTDPKALDAAVAKAARCGVQIATHAIGDRGNRAVLDSYAAHLPKADPQAVRWRIEHAQVVSLADIPRFALLGVIASMQPTHATSDMPWAEARVGSERILGGYAWRRMRDAGVRLALGSDFPVESDDPLLGLYAATSRQDREGSPEGGWYPSEKLTAYEALRGFTLDAAYAGFAEDQIGSLAVGKRADFVLLSRDPLAVAPSELLQTKVLATYVDGKAIYRAP